MKYVFRSSTYIFLKRGIDLVTTMCYVALLCIAVSFSSSYASDENVTSSFSKQTNSRERVRLLKAITDNKGAINVTEAKAMLNLGLSDKKPNVAMEAVLQVGKLKYEEFEGQIIQTYTNASKRYKGHSESVRLACIKSLGKLKGERTASFLARELAKDQGTVQGGFLLHAARELKDPSLIKALERYSLKMAEQIEKGKAAGDDPMLYSRAKQHYELAENTIQLLRDHEGGIK
ncbi:MAG: hypothetical protein CSA25_06270 [Desulfobacter postgatei]|uniref:PBS lyase n=1 Tax=Desulfobacter postgatei TaxID=2293 RepID=A0A2G6MQ44_9BACT|nr:MAG: hypothetical protein CSA25_06270 [Desulfobacter postgatei]